MNWEIRAQVSIGDIDPGDALHRSAGVAARPPDFYWAGAGSAPDIGYDRLRRRPGG